MYGKVKHLQEDCHDYCTVMGMVTVIAGDHEHRHSNSHCHRYSQSRSIGLTQFCI